MSSKRGIENAKRRNAMKVKCVCEHCGASYEITYGRYRHVRKDPNYKFRCSKCFHKLWYEELPPEKRAKFDKAHVDRWANMSPEERAYYANLSKENWEKKSDEEKKRHAELSSKNVKKFWNSISPEYKQQLIDRNISHIRKYLETRSDEEKARISKIMSEHMKRRWMEMSEEDKEKHRKRISVVNKKRWDSLSLQERIEISQHLSKVAVANWISMSKEKRQEWDEHRIAAINKRYKEIPDSLVLNRTEEIVAGVLTLNKINYTPYVYNEQELSEPTLRDPNYVNPITGSTFISLHKQWDFRIHTLTCDLYLDVDGSIHNGINVRNLYEYVAHTNIKYNAADKIAYDDSIRKYYRDDLEAYAIKCYNDMAYDDTEVENLVTGETMRFDEFVAYLKSLDQVDEILSAESK